MNSSNQEKLSPTKARREREKEQRREDIIEAAEKLFLSQGFENTTMKQIANEAQYSKGTLYNYYNSKDDLYIAIGINAYSLIINYTQQFIEKEVPGIKQLMAVGYAYYKFSKDYPNYASIFHNIGTKLPDIISKPENELSNTEKEYLDLSNKYRDLFVNVLTEAVKNNAIRGDTSPFMIGYVLSTITRGLIEDLMHSKDRVKKIFNLEPDDVINFTFELIADGLKPREQ
ncbi:MAG: TetR/AcrR family transcriptional regulator [Candidatus Lokiarchaeia archaeon]|nr:TetR/AcrR family transcriptional regulator [Candidatus Lokiarchaeia archaeon]